MIINLLRMRMRFFGQLHFFRGQVDLIPEEERKERIRQAKEDISAHLKGTK